MRMPEGFERWNGALRGAFEKGMAAYTDGVDISFCPYRDISKPSGKLTWSRAYMNGWLSGWRWAQIEEQTRGR